MIARAFRLEQLLVPDFALGKQLADADLFLVGEARRHRSGGHEDRRQMAEAQRADQQAGDDLVANAEQQRAFEHVMAQTDRSRQRDRVAAEQRQLHAVLPLGDAVAHGWHAARDLRGDADLARPQLDLFGIAAIGLMRRKHVVIRGDDADVHRSPRPDRRLVVARCGKAVRQIAARQLRAVRTAVALALDQFDIGGARRGGSFDDPVGNRPQRRVEVTHANFSRRVRSARCPRSAPSCPHYRLWTVRLHRPIARGSRRSNAIAPRPRRAARTASGRRR